MRIDVLPGLHGAVSYNRKVDIVPTDDDVLDQATTALNNPLYCWVVTGGSKPYGGFRTFV